MSDKLFTEDDARNVASKLGVPDYRLGADLAFSGAVKTRRSIGCSVIEVVTGGGSGGGLKVQVSVVMA
jgi:hypothetical protein